MGKKTKRLDQLLIERGLALDPQKAQAMILAGEVYDEKGLRLNKAGVEYPLETPLHVKSRTPQFVSRSGEKLLAAIDTFHISIKDKVCLDVGASTGGFTHCLLEHGAKHVFAVDVGHGQIDSKLRGHPKVSVFEKLNARYMKRDVLFSENKLAAKIDCLVMDVSFISMRVIIEHLKIEFPEIKEWILLFKPQFEVKKKYISKGGVVKNAAAVQDALKDFQNWMTEFGFELQTDAIPSPIAGKRSGNIEWLLFFR